MTRRSSGSSRTRRRSARSTNEPGWAASGEHLDEPLHPAICECWNDECRDLVFVTPKEYAKVRKHERQFVTAPGHDMPEIERVVYRHDRYWVVEKLDS